MRTENRRKFPLISKYSVITVRTRQINCRKIPLISKYSDIIIGITCSACWKKCSVPLTSESVTSGQVGGVFCQLFLQCRKDPFICTLWVPIQLSFNSQQGPPLSTLLVSLGVTLTQFSVCCGDKFHHCKKKLTENSASLTGCNRLTCKGDGTFFQHADQVNPTNSYDDDGIFRNKRKFPTDNLTSSDNNDGIFRNQRKFPTVSRSHGKEFPTIFRQLSDREKESKSQTAPTRFEPTSFRVTTCYSTTAPHSLSVFQRLLALCYSFSVLC